MGKFAASFAVFTFIASTANPLPMVAAGESPPAKATKASYSGSAAQNTPSPWQWLGDFDPPQLRDMPASGLLTPSRDIMPAHPLPLMYGSPGTPPSLESCTLPPSLLAEWDVTSTRTAIDTLPDRWADIEWMFERNQIAVWDFEKHNAELTLVTSRPSISKVSHSEHIKSVASTDRVATFNYEYEVNAYRVVSLVTLQLSGDKKSFEGTRRITVLERDKHVPCATMQYTLHGSLH